MKDLKQAERVAEEARKIGVPGVFLRQNVAVNEDYIPRGERVFVVQIELPATRAVRQNGAPLLMFAALAVSHGLRLFVQHNPFRIVLE